MRSTVLILGLGGNLEKKEIEFNERIAEQEKEGLMNTKGIVRKILGLARELDVRLATAVKAGESLGAAATVPYQELSRVNAREQGYLYFNMLTGR